MDDISKALAYQVKREMAEQYFGARKVIEEDIEALKPEYKALQDFYDLRIGVDLLRIYSMLKDKDLAEGFMSIIHWQGLPFYDDYMVASRNIARRLQEPVTSWGITAFYRFFNELCNAYELLEKDVREYNDRLESLADEVATINEEIALFERRFSLDEMMSFLRTMDRDPALEGVLGQNLIANPDAREDGLRLAKLPDPREQLPSAPALPALSDIRHSLKDVAKQVGNQ
ncbi:MAG: hypothetical protein PHC35_00615 [Deltaproteobacteria bacterium]|jgi:uncharacterized protein YukE|nr:hypothetical protein [Deltaproteobacteria bacterium]